MLDKRRLFLKLRLYETIVQHPSSDYFIIHQWIIQKKFVCEVGTERLHHEQEKEENKVFLEEVHIVFETDTFADNPCNRNILSSVMPDLLFFHNTIG